MRDFRYLSGVTTLRVDRDACVGCGACLEVCPHAVLALEDRRIVAVDPDGCMECGACTRNCPTSALSVTPGVGCASYIIQVWLKGRDKATCGCDCC